MAEHLQTLLAASQYAPADKPLQDEAVPHLQVPETQVSPETLHGDESEQSMKQLNKKEQLISSKIKSKTPKNPYFIMLVITI